MKKKTRVLLLISSLDCGGAERQLVELVKGLDKAEFSCLVVTTHAQGAFGPELAGLPGVELRSLGKRGGLDVVGPVWRLLRLARAARVDVVYAFEEGPGLLGAIVAAQLGCRLIWGVRNTLSNAAKLGVRANVYRWLHRRLARRADRIIYNSHRAEREYTQAGYPAEKGCTISNGFDSGRFRFDSDARTNLRQEWGLAGDDFVFAVIGSIKPDKNHEFFIRAAVDVGRIVPRSAFVFVGKTYGSHPVLGPYARVLRDRVDRLGLGRRFVWAGEHQEMTKALSAVDVLVLTSRREGTPNVVAEAMLCGRPCIVSDVGDAVHLLGGNGTAIPLDDVQSLVSAMTRWAGVSEDERSALGQIARCRIERDFSMQQMVEKTSAVLCAAS
jgi:glycosyltransferase involved in cell wall biosynthesis